MSTIFTWRAGEIQALLATCDVDEVAPLIHRYFPPSSTILECGCGLGRYVRYLTDRGHRTVGIERLPETLSTVRGVWPDLPLVAGDAAGTPFATGSFDAVLSLGLVEHWTEGPDAALREHFRVLKPGGVAIITVPLHNQVRQWKRRLWFNELADLPGAIRRRVPLRPNRLDASPYPVHPTYGPFYEYRLTRDQFLAAVRGVGFEVLTHQPTAHMDGVYHELNPLKMLVRFRDWRFEPGPVARVLNAGLSRRRFLHSHMQGIVARRPS
ncbi:MAG: class I SAM-dependent methyltransferase [Candidatus Eisenbacteria bacterium]